MLRVIRLTKPQWVIAENVRGILTIDDGLVFEQVCTDLESSGYEVQPFIIPAVAVNAPHRRDRVWFVARNTEYNGQYGSENSKSNKKRSDRNQKRENQFCQPKGADSLREDVTNPGTPRLERRKRPGAGYTGQSSRNQLKERPDWSEDWTKIAARLCSVDDGLPAEMGDFTISKARHRKEQLKAYGNAIVPQVAIEILKGIKGEDNG